MQRLLDFARKAQLPAALTFVVLVVLNTALGWHMPLEALLALSFGAGALGSPRPSEVATRKAGGA